MTNEHCEMHANACISASLGAMTDLLIITNSYDVTTDILLDKLEGESVFRFNFDQIASYQIRIDQDGFYISDPVGRSISSQVVKKAYWRKPFSAEPAERDKQQAWSKYVDAEMRYVLAELVNLLWLDRKFVLVEPHAERRTGKLVQLRHAQGLFPIPDYEFVLNHKSRSTSSVVKSLSNALVGDKVLYTTRAKTEDLDPRFPWFVEQMVAGKQDITVVFVRGQMFSFSLERDFLDKSVDWRRFISPEQEWNVHAMPMSLQETIAKYMKTLHLDYGRLDFLLDDDGQYWFCEVNPNGQFAWLDLNSDRGLLEAVVEELSPARETFPIPNYHPLDRAFLKTREAVVSRK